MALSLLDFQTSNGFDAYGSLDTTTPAAWSSDAYLGNALASGASSGGSSFLQTILGTAATWVGGVAQVDLLKRAQAAQQPTLYSTQAPIQTDATTRAASALGGMRLGDVLPLLLLAGGAFLLLRD